MTQHILLQGSVVQSLKDRFKVKIFPNKETKNKYNREAVLCHISGRLRCHNIEIVPGDKVTVSVSCYDYTKGRIIYRSKD